MLAVAACSDATPVTTSDGSVVVLDGDGRLDINKTLYRAQLADPQPTADSLLGDLPEPWSMQVLDLDGDGTDDVLLASSAGDSGIL